LANTWQKIESGLEAQRATKARSLGLPLRTLRAALAVWLLALSLAGAAWRIYQAVQKPAPEKKQPARPSPEPIAPPLPEISPPQTPPPRRLARLQRKPARAPVPKPDIESSLDQQMNRYAQAKQLAKAGKIQQALALIKDWEASYPQNPLQTEIRLLRVELLYQTRRLTEAQSLLTSLIADDNLAARRASFFRLQGDIFTLRHQCEQASKAYLKALGLGLQDQEAARARAMLQQCQNDSP